MSTPRQGMAGTGGYDAPPSGAEEIADLGSIAERRRRATAKASAGMPEDTILLTSREPENIAYNIVIDMDHILQGAVTPSGFLVWFCPTDLIERVKRHMLVLHGRVVLPEEHAKTAEHKAEPQPPQAQHPTQKAPEHKK